MTKRTKRKYIRRSIMALLYLLCICITPLHAQAIDTKDASTSGNLKVYHETKDFFAPKADGYSLNTYESWAKFDINGDMTSVNIELNIGEKSYRFEALGSAEAAGDGYVGYYKGYIIPDEDDTLLRPLLMPEEAGLFTSVNAIFCDDEML